MQLPNTNFSIFYTLFQGSKEKNKKITKKCTYCNVNSVGN
jgi:hypothetical protein